MELRLLFEQLVPQAVTDGAGTLVVIAKTSAAARKRCQCLSLDCVFTPVVPALCFSYCSAFPDTDAPFGSVGTFWGFKPRKYRHSNVQLC
mgnify:CR=1 FL=1